MQGLKMHAAPGLALAQALVSSPADAQYYGDGMGMWQGSWGRGHMTIGSVVILLFWGGLIALVVLFIRWFGGGRTGRSDLSSSSPRAVRSAMKSSRNAGACGSRTVRMEGDRQVE